MNNTDKKERIDKVKLERAINNAIDYDKKRLKWYIDRANTVTDHILKGINYEEASKLCAIIAELENVKNLLEDMTTPD
jgi:hypothetical protein